MSDEISVLEQRLLAQQTIIAFLIAQLRDRGFLDADDLRTNVDMVSELNKLGEMARSDIELVFGVVDLQADLMALREASPDVDA